MDVLKAILDIEKKAQNVIDTFDSITVEETESIKEELKKLEEDENKDTSLKIEKIKAKNEEYLKTELEKSTALMAEKDKALEKKFSENEKLWISEIIERITGGDVI